MQLSTLWIGKSLSKIEQICMASAVDAGYTMNLYTYNKIDYVPKGVTLKDANTIIPNEKIFQYGAINKAGKGSYAGFANWFRYEMIKVTGDIWIDADIIILNKIPSFDDYCFGFQDELGFINNAVLGAKTDSNGLIDKLIEVAKNPLLFYPWDTRKLKLKKLYSRILTPNDPGNIPWGSTGPKALTGLIQQLNISSQAQKREVFYPVLPSNWKYISEVGSYDKLISNRNTSMIHLWNEYMRRDNFNKNGSFQDGSLLGEFEKRLKKYFR